MDKTIDQQIADALELLPVEGEVDFDAYKAQLYAQNPDNGKVVFTHMIKNKLFSRRLEVNAPDVLVYVSRKAV